uniref:Probable methylthioribulose-1-phosphate dehydratase n=1 Tax=Globisporangium ultimum (strain ATCC 200006 / CBS 805.95 / DAOM BR144) TaxID=431595 RepID=K3WWJ7_GLOUD
MNSMETPVTELEHELRLHYLDSAVERASLTILRQVGVTFPRNALQLESNGVETTVDLLTDQELHAEHTNRTGAITYVLKSGRVFLDVRDSGDSWIRILLNAGTPVTLAAGVLHRFVPDATYAPHHAVTATESVAEGDRCLVARFDKPSDAIQTMQYHKYRELICELCRQFYQAGWVTGTGGSISIRFGNRIYMTPSGVQKERIQPDELYLLDIDGAILNAPKQKPGQKYPKLSDCSPLFLHSYRIRNAGAVIHSHGMTCNIITALCDGKSEFRITHQEMIKGLAGHGYHDDLVIPIIENTAKESDLADSLAVAIRKYPQASAVLVRRHGIYVWGDSWEAAKRHSECLHYLFEAAIDMHKLNIDFTVAPKRSVAEESSQRNKRARTDASETTETAAESIAEQHKFVLLDIEGTTTPITFVHDVLFPYAKENVSSFLEDTWSAASTQAVVTALREQARLDGKLNEHFHWSILPADADQDKIIESVFHNVMHNMRSDRKLGPLKQLQGYIWDRGYQSGDLKALVYDDVTGFMQRMEEKDVRVGIYSSGSRQAQKLLFQYSDQGDLRKYLTVYFDTKVGHKRETQSYEEILLSLNVDSGKDVLFVTDIIEEAEAASRAGLDVVLSVRPGNKPLPATHPFHTIQSFEEL